MPDALRRAGEDVVTDEIERLKGDWHDKGIEVAVGTVLCE
jgi:hypothetical protein